MSRAKITPAMLERAQGGSREAVGEIVVQMQAALWKVAGMFASRYPALDLDDLYQIGSLAVLRAIRRWDPARGSARFMTYAFEAIVNSARRAARQAIRDAERQAPTDPADLDRFTVAEPQIDPAILEALAPAEARVIALRLGPILVGKNPRQWRTVARTMRKSVEATLSLYRAAVAKLRSLA